MPPTSAARWTTSSGSASANSRAASSQEVRSYSARRATNGSCPAARKRSTTCEPRKPPPPVTSTLTASRLVAVEDQGAAGQLEPVTEARAQRGQQRRPLVERSARVERGDVGRVAQHLRLGQRAGVEAEARRVDVLARNPAMREEGDDRLVADHELVRPRQAVEARRSADERGVLVRPVQPDAV